MKQLKPPHRRWTTKHASENCGVGLTLLHWKKQDDDKCPHCGNPEDTLHVLQCLACGADDKWKENLTRLNTFMEEADTHPDIHRAIYQSYRNFITSNLACMFQLQDALPQPAVRLVTTLCLCQSILLFTSRALTESEDLALRQAHYLAF